MLELKNLDLRTDAAAQRVVKDETVSVEFAVADGELMSLEGPNRYVRGDALITGSTGDRWVVSRDRFDAKYTPAVMVSTCAFGDVFMSTLGSGLNSTALGALPKSESGVTL